MKAVTPRNFVGQIFSVGVPMVGVDPDIEAVGEDLLLGEGEGGEDQEEAAGQDKEGVACR